MSKNNTISINTDIYRVWHVDCWIVDRPLNLKNARVMRTTKIILSIALVALTATSFGQLSLKERISAKRNNGVAYYTVDYTTENNRPPDAGLPAAK